MSRPDDHLTGRDVAVSGLAIVAIAAYGVLVNTWPWLAWVVIAVVVGFVLVGSIVVLVIEPRTTRRREVSRAPSLPRARSLPSTRGPGHTRGLTRPARARTTLPEAARRRPSSSFWF